VNKARRHRARYFAYWADRFGVNSNCVFQLLTAQESVEERILNFTVHMPTLTKETFKIGPYLLKTCVGSEIFMKGFFQGKFSDA